MPALFHVCPVAVVVAFFICWAPFHIQRLVSAYSSSTSSSSNDTVSTSPGGDDDGVSAAGLHASSAAPSLAEAVFFYVSGVLYYVSSVINPILYNIMSL